MQNTTRNSRRLNLSVIHIAALGVVIGLALTGCGGSDLTGGTMLSKPPRPTTIRVTQATASVDSTTKAEATPDENPMDVMPLLQNGMYQGTMKLADMAQPIQVDLEFEWNDGRLTGVMGLVRGTEKAGYPLAVTPSSGNARLDSTESGSGSTELISELGSFVSIECYPSRDGESIVAIAQFSGEKASSIQFEFRPLN